MRLAAVVVGVVLFFVAAFHGGFAGLSELDVMALASACYGLWMILPE